MTDSPARAEAPVAWIDAIRARLERAARPFQDGTRTLDSLIAEAVPFLEATRRATASDIENDGVAWREARSFAWLLSYRLGDQGWPAHVAAAIVPAWRGVSAASENAADEIQSLMLEGFSRGREDRARTEAQRGLAAALPVTEIAPRVMIVIAAGALDPDGATALADRASSFMLRKDITAALLDVEGLAGPTAAVLAELWAIPSAARMLGVRMVVSGLSGVVAEAVTSSSLHDEGEERTATLRAGVEAVLRRGSTRPGLANAGFGARVRRWFRAR